MEKYIVKIKCKVFHTRCDQSGIVTETYFYKKDGEGRCIVDIYGEGRHSRTIQSPEYGHVLLGEICFPEAVDSVIFNSDNGKSDRLNLVENIFQNLLG